MQLYFIDYVCDFSKSNCTLDQLNDDTIKWDNKLEGTVKNPNVILTVLVYSLGLHQVTNIIYEQEKVYFVK